MQPSYDPWKSAPRRTKYSPLLLRLPYAILYPLWNILSQWSLLICQKCSISARDRQQKAGNEWSLRSPRKVRWKKWKQQARKNFSFLLSRGAHNSMIIHMFFHWIHRSERLPNHAEGLGFGKANFGIEKDNQNKGKIWGTLNTFMDSSWRTEHIQLSLRRARTENTLHMQSQ